MATRAGVYVRISQDPHGEARGVARQERDCRALCDARGWEVADVYSDNDTSAYRGKRRAAFERLLADVRAKRIGAVVAYHPDRLYRHPRDLEALVDTVEAAGAKMATVAAGDFDLGTASGRMVARMLGAAARGESERSSERIRRQRLAQVEAGQRQGGGRRPFGYTRSMEVDPVEAAAIREAAEALLGGASFYSVAERLNAQGITTPAGNRWLPAKLRRALTRPLLAGLREHKPTGTVTRGAWEPILTDDEHRLLAARFPTVAGGRPARRTALLSGLLRCSECDRKMMASAGRYLCDRPRGGGCGAVRVNDGRALEVAVLRLAEERARRPHKRRDSQRDAALVRLRQVEERLDALAAAFADGVLDRGRYEAQRARVLAERDDAEAALRDLGGSTDEAHEALHDALVEWQRGATLDPADLAALQDGIVQTLGEVVVHPGGDIEPRRG